MTYKGVRQTKAVSLQDEDKTIKKIMDTITVSILEIVKCLKTRKH